MRLLLIEDDNLLGEGIRDWLIHDGYAIDWFTRAQDIAHAIKIEHFDLMILDIGLPDGDGLAVLKQLREQGEQIPVLILTARDAIHDRIEGLDSGADDYLVKPCDLHELSARIRALVRRNRGNASNVIKCDGLTLDMETHQVLKNGDPIEFSPREFSLLQTLLINMGRPVSRNRLLESLYDWDKEINSNTMEVHIHHIRKKLGNGMIRTIRGLGYQIDRQDEH
ncbi:MAG: DNA-binding response regulator [Sedimenticola sp.]|jgi:DNA-binding response OmpR family regulator|nr:MAG: DNA-binding response regulator [Sedimenticola sp.]